MFRPQAGQTGLLFFSPFSLVSNQWEGSKGEREGVGKRERGEESKDSSKGVEL